MYINTTIDNDVKINYMTRLDISQLRAVWSWHMLGNTPDLGIHFTLQEANKEVFPSFNL